MISVTPEGFGLATRNGGTCSICGCGNTDPETKLGRPCISTGIQIAFEGWFDICVNCSAIIGSLVGMIDSSAYDLLLEDYNRLCHLLDDQTVELLKKEEVLNALRSDWLTVVPEEPDFAESQAERDQTYSVDR